MRTDHAGRIAGLALGVSVLAGAWAVGRLNPPAVVSADAPATVFSGARALEDLRVIAREVHPAGSEAHGRVRAHLLARMKELGLEPAVHEGRDEWSEEITGGTLYNLIGRRRGSANTRALVLATHYDSAPGSYGAGDAGASVAALLETTRALAAGPPLRNDLIVLITDGEELGLCGARAFARDRREDVEVGAVVNFEARGTSGPSILFETSEGNGRLVEAFASGASRPVTTSLAYEVYRRMPNDTDLTVFKAIGWPGVGFAFIRDVKNYHTPGDNLENLDPRSLQHHGDNALAMARALGAMDLTDVRAPDAVFFDVGALFVVRYPAAWALPLAGLAVVLWAGLAAWGRRRGAVALRRAALGAALSVGVLILAAGAAWGTWAAAKGIHGPAPFRVMVAMASHPAGLVAGALWSVATAGTLAALGARRLGAAAAALGGLSVWTILALAGAIWVPGASYLFFWPLLGALVGTAASWATPEPADAGAGLPANTETSVAGAASAGSTRAILALAGGALPGVVLIAPTAALFFDAMTWHLAPAHGIVAGLLLILLQPVLAALRPRFVTGVAILAALAGSVAVGIAVRAA